jgi:hypothetical protein
MLIPAGSSWRYNDSGSDLGTAWRAISYADAAWPAGVAQLGYGDGDEATVISYGTSTTNRRITYYFRRTFTLANPSALAALVVRYVRDDGAIIYLNGVEVVRSNMPTGTVTNTTRATTAISGTAESTWLEAPLDPALLVAGTNVVAVEVHQQSPTSTDVTFDLELRATEAQPQGPSAMLLSPANHGITNTPTVTFTATVSAPAGLSSATLFVGGPPQTVTFSGPAQIDDAAIVADTPTVADGAALSFSVDGQSPHAHVLMKFPGLVGSGGGQVPAGATIAAATLTLNCTNPGNTMRLYRLTQSWIEGEATWNQRSTGVSWGAPGADGAASNAGVPLTGDCTVTGQRLVDLTLFVQEWVNGTPNLGLVFIESGTDGVVIGSSESAASPVLSVTYKSQQQPVETQPVSGSTAQVSFAATLPLAQTSYWNVRVTDTESRQGWAAADFDIAVDTSAPDAPQPVLPANGSTGASTSPSVSAFVSNPGGGPLNVSVALRRAVQPEFTIIALPDTQHYSEAYPAIFTSQTQWIVNNKASRNIVFVTHEGDIVEHQATVIEWQRANTSLSMLDGVVPYGMGPGNHDLPTTNFNLYFPYTRYVGQPWYGGHYQNVNDNNYQLFSGGGIDFVIVHLAFCPPAGAVAWASSVLQSYPERVGIMTTHGYLGLNAERSVHSCTSTQYIWDGLAVPNPNLRFMLAGHVHGESRRTDSPHGVPVYQMLADYQSRASGGEGWLRILRFVPADDKIYVQTYSPWLNRFETDADSQFSLDFPMGGAFTTAGSTTVASGSTATIPLAGLAAGTEYEWQVTVTNSSGKSRTGPVWSFTTGGGAPVNQLPSANAQSVSTPEDAPLAVTLTGSDPEGQPLTYSVVGVPAHGTLAGSATALTYQPAANYNGPDSFTFRVNDGAAASATATVSITVQPVNDAPTAGGDSYSVASGGTLTVAAPGVLGNDADVDGPTLAAQLVSGPANGNLTLNAAGSLTYSPAAGYSGTDTFTYRVSDGQAASGVVTVSITVAADATPPVRTNGLPTGVLAAGTPQATLGLTTNEAATCRYSPTAGVAYASMANAFTTTGATNHSTTVTGLSSGTSYVYYVKCRDAALNANTDDFPIAFSVAAALSGPIAAYGFNEGAGTTLNDRSGRGHTGTISGATWSTAGRYGGALSFDGVNDWVTINDTAVLDLTTGMTLEAWVNASAVTNWRTVVLKERTGSLSYALYGANGASRPAAYVNIGGADVGVNATANLALNTWTHLAVTYDGATIRVYVNGTQVATRAQTGPITTSTGVLRIGGNAVWSEFFQGLIDEVRIYSRALTAAEIQADMATPITP